MLRGCPWTVVANFVQWTIPNDMIELTENNDSNVGREES